MAWTAPRTWVLNETLTAALLNAQIRDNMALQAPALASYRRGYFVTTGANALKYRRTHTQSIHHEGWRSATTYGDITTGDSSEVGPAVTCETGTDALVIYGCRVQSSVSGVSSYASVAVTGATTIAASDDWSIRWRTSADAKKAISQFQVWTTLTAGENTFTMKYRAGVSGDKQSFNHRRIMVMPLT